MLNYRYHVKLSNSIFLDGERQRYSIFFYQHLAAFVYPRSTLAKDRDRSKAVASSLSLNLMISSAQILKIKEIKKGNVKRYIERCFNVVFYFRSGRCKKKFIVIEISLESGDQYFSIRLPAGPTDQLLSA